MKRTIVAILALATLCAAGCASSPITGKLSPSDWQSLRSRLSGKLIEVQAPKRGLKNPYAIQDDPAGTQSLGWLGAWEVAPSAYAVAAQNAQDVAAAVEFASDHNLRLVVKGTGHDYLGRSNAPDSLLVWTHPMRKVTVIDAFVPRGCPAAQTPVPAVSVEAGTRWAEAYEEVTVKHGRYVQGGGCTSVGAAGGFLQGGGFGSWSNKYGTAASNLLQAEVVTANGKIMTANACFNPDLFWALRGGGGGTYGVVTKATLKTHPVADFMGFVDGSVEASSDEAFKELLQRFVEFYRGNLANENWGEQVSVRRSNRLNISMSFIAMSADDARKVWRPFLSQLEKRPKDFKVKADFIALPGNRMWDARFIKQHAPDAIREDDRANDSSGLYWWSGDAEQVGAYWYAYQSRWIPATLFAPAHAKAFAQALFDASRHWTLGLHFNKGQAGASTDAMQRGRETSINPKLYDAAALMIIAATADDPQKPDAAEGEEAKAHISAAMKIIRDITPGAGSYVNETDYFEPDWQQSFWGENYPRLLAIKRKYDPDNLFTCHHCVGSTER